MLTFLDLFPGGPGRLAPTEKSGQWPPKRGQRPPKRGSVGHFGAPKKGTATPTPARPPTQSRAAPDSGETETAPAKRREAGERPAVLTSYLPGWEGPKTGGGLDGK